MRGGGSSGEESGGGSSKGEETGEGSCLIGRRRGHVAWYGVIEDKRRRNLRIRDSVENGQVSS